MFKRFYRLLSSFGIYPKLIRQSAKGWKFYRKDLREIKRQLKDNKDFTLADNYPVLRERFETNGDLKSHYFHEDLSVAQRVFENRPQRHVDVGSRVDGFVAHIATFREIEVFDIRPQQAVVQNVKFVTADFMNIPASLHNYTDSLSSLNVIEHFGLGRYGDPIDVDGHLKGLENMYHVLKPGGKFYFSTPIGPQRIEFNAHRVFSLAYLLKIFQSNYTIDRFSYVDDRGDLHQNVDLTPEVVSSNCGCRFGFGIFEMTKKVDS
jgi:SAM-dependent methyltransferase